MKTQTYLQVATPCNENWDKMTPKEQGRHCDSCEKVVIDFSIMTDQQILSYLTKSGSDKICGRFGEDQLQRALIDTQTAKKKVWQYAVAGFGALFMMLDKASAQRGSKIVGKPAVTKVPTKAPIISLNDVALVKGELVTSYEEITLKAKVVNEDGKAICGAKIIMANDDNTVITNKEGKFVMQTKKMNTLGNININAEGYDTKMVNAAIAQNTDTTIVLSAKNQMNIQDPFTSPIANDKIIMGALVAYKTEEKSVDTIPVLVSKIFTKNTMFKVSPNPATKNGVLNITTNAAGTYSVQIFDGNSRFIHVQRITVTGKGQQTAIQVAGNLAAGIYYIKLIDESTKKEYVEKIVVG